MKLYVLSGDNMPYLFITATSQVQALSKFKEQFRMIDEFVNHPTFSISEVTSIEHLIALAPDDPFHLQESVGW